MIYSSPIGTLELAFDGPVLTSLHLALAGSHTPAPASPSNVPAIRWLDCYFSGREPDFIPPLEPQGTPFQRCVWQELLKVPYGQTVTYGELARRIGCRSAQAVGQALNRNPIAIIVPCHRVVAASGLGGYAYGLEIKRKLLNLEKHT